MTLPDDIQRIIESGLDHVKFVQVTSRLLLESKKQPASRVLANQLLEVQTACEARMDVLEENSEGWIALQNLHRRLQRVISQINASLVHIEEIHGRLDAMQQEQRRFSEQFAQASSREGTERPAVPDAEVRRHIEELQANVANLQRELERLLAAPQTAQEIEGRDQQGGGAEDVRGTNAEHDNTLPDPDRFERRLYASELRSPAEKKIFWKSEVRRVAESAERKTIAALGGQDSSGLPAMQHAIDLFYTAREHAQGFLKNCNQGTLVTLRGALNNAIRYYEGYFVPEEAETPSAEAHGGEGGAHRMHQHAHTETVRQGATPRQAIRKITPVERAALVDRLQYMRKLLEYITHFRFISGKASMVHSATSRKDGLPAQAEMVDLLQRTRELLGPDRLNVLSAAKASPNKPKPWREWYVNLTRSKIVHSVLLLLVGGGVGTVGYYGYKGVGKQFSPRGAQEAPAPPQKRDATIAGWGSAEVQLSSNGKKITILLPKGILEKDIINRNAVAVDIAGHGLPHHPVGLSNPKKQGDQLACDIDIDGIDPAIRTTAGVTVTIQAMAGGQVKHTQVVFRFP